MAKILVVEDEMIAAMAIEEIVRDLQHEVVGPLGRLSAVLRLLDDPIGFDVALLDVRLRNGAVVFPAAAILEAQKIPYAFTTAYGRNGIEPQFAHHPVVTKPYARQDIERVIADLLDQRAALH